MSIIYLLVPIALLFVMIAAALFYWSVKSDQYEDLDREGYAILFDEEMPAKKKDSHHE